MNPSPLFSKRREREFFAHHMLLHAAGLEVEHAEKTEVGRFNKCLAAMVMTALAVEALANAVGTRSGIFTTEFERGSPLDKLDALVAHLKLVREPSQEPWTSIRFLVGFRNDIAHPKPELVVTEHLLPDVAFRKVSFDAPLSKLEREITTGNARRVHSAVQELKTLLFEALPEDQRFAIYGDMWSESGRLVE